MPNALATYLFEVEYEIQYLVISLQEYRVHVTNYCELYILTNNQKINCIKIKRMQKTTT